MAVTISLGEGEATILLNRWVASDKRLRRLITLFSDRLLVNYTPWPDYTLAEMACKALGGKIISATDPPEYVEGRVY